MTHSTTVELAQALIRRESVTPEDAGCQALLTEKLEALGFSCETLAFEDVTNLWAVRGNASPLLVFAGHTDVVPTGSLEQWQIPPFEGRIANDMLHGRGAADMKGSIASFVSACERFLETHGNHNGSIGLLITSDEEGIAKHGTKRVIETLVDRGTGIDMCIVGEPTSVEKCGDMVKVGRRGSLNATLTIHGKQGHIAYPHLAENPLHTALPALQALVDKRWDNGNENFQATCFQYSNIHGGAGATNVIPGEITAQFNFRYSPESTHEQLMDGVHGILDRSGVSYEIDWERPSLPYETKSGNFVENVASAIHHVTGITTEQTTTGGTSDGRFIATTGAQVVELGPVNATIHQIDEQVLASDLDVLSRIYERVLEQSLLVTEG